MIFSLLAAATQHLRPGNPAIWDNSGSMLRQTAAKENVDPMRAMALGAYAACVRVLGEDTAKLPLFVYRRGANGERERAMDRPEYQLLQSRSNHSATAMTVRETLVRDCAGWGNGIGEIERNGRGDPIGIHNLEASRVEPFFDDYGHLRWSYRDKRGQKHAIAREDTVHVAGPSDNGLIGWPIAYYASEAIGTGLAQQKYAGSFYGNGANLQGILTHPHRLKPEGRKRLIDDWKKMHAGAQNANGTAVLEDGMTWSPVSVSPRDAEILKSRQYTDVDVCGWFRMPLAKIQRHSQAKGWSTTEAESISYVRDTLLAWLIRVEQALNFALFPYSDEYYVEHLVDGLLRADSQARATYYNKMMMAGAMNQNEIRRAENLPSLGKDGDEYWIPQNMMPLSKALAKEDKPPMLPAPAPPPEDTEDDESDDEDEANARWLEHAASRILRKEGKAVKRIAGKDSLDDDGRAAELGKLFATIATDLLEEFRPAAGGEAECLEALCIGVSQKSLAEYLASSDYGATYEQRAKSCPKAWAAQVLGVVAAFRRVTQ